jgi:hypothetical protein
MEVALMHIEILHTTIFQWGKKNGQWIEETFWDWNPIQQMFSPN